MRIHSAKRIFQALRIEVNQELKCLKVALEQSGRKRCA
uniref:16S rRNA (Cytosine(1402)-N(4))-methyltransferase n=1 Tax=Candidatus Phytoplasma australasiaticum subsp. australasiaticum TaxID=2832407 RepID=A0A7S7FZZ0_9MOLU|nr:16S rRNA (cytosine(1402)-N(4))-methyltransferase ['Parthenium hysterophorus' phyllody phytoplasma]